MALPSASQAVAAKARAMVGRCLTAADYRQLTQCRSVSEVAEYLKTRTHYAEALADVNEAAVHRGYLESALRRKLFEDYQTLTYYDRSMNRRMSDYYLRKSEIELIVRCLLMMRAGRMEDFLFSVPSFLSGRTRLQLRRMAAAADFDEVVDAAAATPYGAILRRFLPASIAAVSLTAVENALYAYLYKRLYANMEASPKGEREELRRLYGAQVDSMQVTRIRRMKTYFHLPAEQIAANLLPVTGSLSRQTLKDMIEAETDEQVLERFFATAGRYVDEEQRRHPDDLPMRLPYKAARHALHFSRYPQVVFSAYIMLTEMELDDLVNIIEGVRYGLPPSEIAAMLVMDAAQAG
ncbi:MAG: V0D/AC39 family V-type ATPase subunit [Acutalibacteraceae bacterium]